MDRRQDAMNDATLEALAAEHDLAEAVSAFTAAAIRDSAAELNAATERAHAAVQRRLDAVSSMYALARRAAGM